VRGFGTFYKVFHYFAAIYPQGIAVREAFYASGLKRFSTQVKIPGNEQTLYLVMTKKNISLTQTIFFMKNQTKYYGGISPSPCTPSAAWIG
jgi:hypothetical protein